MTVSVLVVEDDDDLRAGLRTLFEDEDLEVLGARTLREAKAVRDLYEPQVLLVDGMLPDGSGIDWITELRARGCDAEVVFMSSFYAKGDWLEVLAGLGVKHRLDKRETPIERIAEIVAQAIQLRS